jgi:hypothetical protein
MARDVSKAQLRVMVAIRDGDALDATDTRTVGALERKGLAINEGQGWRLTWAGRDELAGRY